MRAQVVLALPGEDTAALEARRDAWLEELAPVGNYETYLVNQAVDSSWRLDRCQKTETVRLERAMRAATSESVRLDSERLTTLKDELFDHPERSARRLRAFSEGVVWLIARFTWLSQAIQTRGYWEPSEKDLTLLLLGKRPDSLFIDPFVLDLSEAFLNSGWSEVDDLEKLSDLLNLDDYPKGMKQYEFERRLIGFSESRKETLAGGEATRLVEEAREFLLKVVDEETERLRERLGWLEADEAVDRVEAVLSAKTDLSAEGQALARYEASHRRAFQTSIRNLQTHQKTSKAGNGKSDPSVDDAEPQANEATRPSAGIVEIDQTLAEAKNAPQPNEPNRDCQGAQVAPFTETQAGLAASLPDLGRVSRKPVALPEPPFRGYQSRHALTVLRRPKNWTGLEDEWLTDEQKRLKAADRAFYEMGINPDYSKGLPALPVNKVPR